MMKRRQRGQGMTEVIIIVALIAIGTIGVATAYGDRIRLMFGTSADGLAGDTNAGNGKQAPDTSGTQKNLSNFAGAEEGGGPDRSMSSRPP